MLITQLKLFLKGFMSIFLWGCELSELSQPFFSWSPQGVSGAHIICYKLGRPAAGKFIFIEINGFLGVVTRCPEDHHTVCMCKNNNNKVTLSVIRKIASQHCASACPVMNALRTIWETFQFKWCEWGLLSKASAQRARLCPDSRPFVSHVIARFGEEESPCLCIFLKPL